MKFLLVIIVLATSLPVNAAEMRMAVTTSFHNSGLSETLLPEIRADLGLDVRLIVVGTGQALKLGRAGDVDALLVHSQKAEEEFVAEGYGSFRQEIMYNDFVIVGPSDDPAKVVGAKTITAALESIRKSQSTFVSRGDDSGTHRKEQALWSLSGNKVFEFPSNWYNEVGAGMGAALNTASGLNAYILSDRASWLKFKNKGKLKILFSNDPSLLNQYAYLPINPKRHSHVKYKLANQLATWLISEKGQLLIGDYKISGQMLFIPNANIRQTQP